MPQIEEMDFLKPKSLTKGMRSTQNTNLQSKLLINSSGFIFLHLMQKFLIHPVESICHC